MLMSRPAIACILLADRVRAVTLKPASMSALTTVGPVLPVAPATATDWSGYGISWLKDGLEVKLYFPISTT